MDFNSLAKMAIEAGALRFHVVSGTVPVLQFSDRIEKLSMSRLSPPEVYAIVGELLDEASKKNLFERAELLLLQNYSTDISFRVHIFKQRGTLGFSAKKVLNSIMEPAEVPVFPPLLDLLKNRRGGLVIISGLSDSGRTSTENSLLHFLAGHGSRHIIQLTDCPEGNFPAYPHSFFSRRVYGLDLLAGSAGLSAISLEDFDVLSLGDLDEPEKLEKALTFAAGGVFVTGILLAPDIEATIRKIQNNIQTKPDLRTRFSESLIGIINQRFIQPQGRGRVFASETMCANSIVRKHLLDNNHYALQNYIKTTSRDDCVSYEKNFKDLIARGFMSADDLPVGFNHLSVV